MTFHFSTMVGMTDNVLRLAEVPQVETSDYSTPSSGILANRLLYAVAVS